MSRQYPAVAEPISDDCASQVQRRDSQEVPDTLIRNISHLVTFDANDRELDGADLLVSGSRVAAVGYGLEADDSAEVIDGRGLLVLPGLINGHQHLYQVGLRSFVELERAPIHPWLTALHVKTLYLWRQGHYTPASVGAEGQAGMPESLLDRVKTVAAQH